MRLDRVRPYADAAGEAARAWFAAAEQSDRARRIVDERIVGDRRAAADVRATEPFGLIRSLELAIRAIPAGASLLLITDGLALTAEDDDTLVRAARRFDATVLLASDPWLSDLPLRGFVRLRDVATGRTARIFVGRGTRRRYLRASRERDDALRERFRRARWRVGTLDEAGGAESLERAFGLVPEPAAR